MKIQRRFVGSCLCVIVAIIFAILSYKKNDWLWFSRSGALIVVIAIFVEYIPTLVVKNVMETKYYPQQIDHDSTRTSAVLVVLGTLIWGFGDLIGKI